MKRYILFIVLALIIDSVAKAGLSIDPIPSINQIDTDVVSFSSQNHSDVTATTSAVNSFSSQAHTDSITLNSSINQVDSDLNSFKSANHTDVNQVNATIQTPLPRQMQVRSTQPSTFTNGSYQVPTLNSYGLIAVSQFGYINTLWGEMFSVSTGNQVLSGNTEVPFFYFYNAPNSAKTAKIYSISLGPTLGNNYVTYGFYRDPVITASGTLLTAVGNRDNSQASSALSEYLTPTASSNGSLFRSITVSGLTGNDLVLDINYTLWVEPGHSLLITRKLSANATIGGVDLQWAEQ